MKIGKEQIRLANVERDVCFPDTGNAGWHIKNILSGKDYPPLGSSYTPTCIVDVGANVGATALFFAATYPTADIFCYEPSPSNLEFLKQNTDGLEKIHIFEYGLNDHDSKLKLYLGRSQCLQHSIHPSIEVTERHEAIEVRKASVALAEILSGRCILKIDTEGCEVPVLRDLESLFEAVDIIYLEYHSEKDRRTIDQLLSTHFVLWHSQASLVHRGNLAFLSTRILEEYPELGKWEVKESV